MFTSVCVKVEADLEESTLGAFQFYTSGGKRASLACSGILLQPQEHEPGIVITSASILVPLLDQSTRLANGVTVQVAGEASVTSTEVRWVPATLKAVVDFPDIRNVITHLISSDPSGWHVGYSDVPLPRTNLSDLSSGSMDSIGLTGIAILRLHHPLHSSANNTASRRICTDPPLCTPLHIHGIPFSLVNPATFIGYTTQCIISAKLTAPRSEGVLYVVDARTFAGMQGGMVVCAEGGDAIGLVLPRVVRRCVDPIELTLVVPLHTVMSAVSRNLTRPMVIAWLASQQLSTTNRVSEVMDMTASWTILKVEAVTSGKSQWGSAICVGNGMCISNAHVVNEYSTNIRVRFGVSKEWHLDCQVLHSSTTADFCILLIPNPPEQAVNARITHEQAMTRRSRVYAVGFGGYVGPDGPPMISAGIVSNIVEMKRHSDESATPWMIISSAVCHNGCSGGGLFTEDGRLIGLITANAETQEGHIYPTVNFSLPVGLLTGAIEAVKHGKPSSARLKLNVDDEQFRKLWTFSGLTHNDVLMEKERRSIKPRL
ncbi:trypsin-like serine protease [Saitoella complicata NRRL Y-17804]|uniref:Peroxisomal leader peptide-processing protease n=1 Tax=Saitoella complicata (strain BCRC 22490 / CBS 7301 / JCM 7358 / NBRC 10748 / NRRL Y-17804) TaxID=698492 RepID=A0A0E9NQ58_SAICN|nr:trypsin-like serine protease [Saitoella complicata NRRL Y-17804]ODQ54994.1 trypsin-like serine protease [Saitoella complicata NRRL Y-17804]GAO51560.1 hypothetical protein G7K_5659-t1 [Saitoella complicata NRRL Y-17804]